jgi:hypothetical protein
MPAMVKVLRETAGSAGEWVSWRGLMVAAMAICAVDGGYVGSLRRIGVDVLSLEHS